MGIDLYGFVEGFNEAKGVWENISPLTDQSQLNYDGYGYPMLQIKNLLKGVIVFFLRKVKCLN